MIKKEDMIAILQKELGEEKMRYETNLIESGVIDSLDIVSIIENDKFDINKFDNYISLLQENKDIETIFIDLDPTVIELRKEKYYIDNYLERYLSYHTKYPDKSISEVIKCVNSNIDVPFYTNMKKTDMSKGYLILVNKYNLLDKNYSPKLTNMSNYGGGSLETKTAEAYKKMYEAAKKDNIKLVIVSPYRSYNTQQSLYNRYVNRDGKDKADTYSARPGSSEHQTGMGVDINTASSGSNFQNTNEYKWLIENSYKYGFILRYPKGSEYITGYKFEPWHYRYVGIEAATKIHDENITFEEYYAYYVLNNN